MTVFPALRSLRVTPRPLQTGWIPTIIRLQSEGFPLFGIVVNSFHFITPILRLVLRPGLAFHSAAGLVHVTAIIGAICGIHAALRGSGHDLDVGDGQGLGTVFDRVMDGDSVAEKRLPALRVWIDRPSLDHVKPNCPISKATNRISQLRPVQAVVRSHEPGSGSYHFCRTCFIVNLQFETVFPDRRRFVEFLYDHEVSSFFSNHIAKRISIRKARYTTSEEQKNERRKNHDLNLKIKHEEKKLKTA